MPPLGFLHPAPLLTSKRAIFSNFPDNFITSDNFITLLKIDFEPVI